MPKHNFDFFELQLRGGCKADVFFLGSGKAVEYAISTQAKRWYERMSVKGDVPTLPNIVLKRGLRSFRMVFTRREGQFYHFAVKGRVYQLGGGIGNTPQVRTFQVRCAVVEEVLGELRGSSPTAA